MERLTIASTEVLNSVVVYVLDMSGFSQPVDRQIEVWHDMKQNHKLLLECNGQQSNNWIDVISKSDLLEESLVSSF